MKKHSLLLLTLTLGLRAVWAAETAPAPLAWPDEKIDTWRGYKRHVFKVDGCTAWVVEPKEAAPGRPWTWCMEFPDAFTERTGVPQLLAKGFHHLHIQVGNSFGSPAALTVSWFGPNPTLPVTRTNAEPACPSQRMPI